MLLAFYKANQPGWRGWADRLIRWRLRGPYSHCELVFEPEDVVNADLMPDKNMEPTINGSLWCASSTMDERLPAWSARRAGKRGGVRFKRIVLDPARWDFLRVPQGARHAIDWFRLYEGAMYDWQFVAGFFNWAVPNKPDRWTCSEACAAALGYLEPWRFDPCSLYDVQQLLNNFPKPIEKVSDDLHANT